MAKVYVAMTGKIVGSKEMTERFLWDIRLLTRYLAGGRTVQEAKYEELCDHSSDDSLCHAGTHPRPAAPYGTVNARLPYRK